MRYTILALAAFALSGPALADEVWTSDDGEIVYETDLEGSDIAVLAMEGVKAYIPGLAGNYDDRGSYSGIWIADEASDADNCAVAVVRPGSDEESSNIWGQIDITFIDASYPSVWIAEIGYCFDAPVAQLIARPVTADTVEAGE